MALKLPKLPKIKKPKLPTIRPPQVFSMPGMSFYPGPNRNMLFLIVFSAVILMVITTIGKAFSSGSASIIVLTVIATILGVAGVVRNITPQASFIENLILSIVSLICIGYVWYELITEEKKKQEPKEEEKKSA